MADIPVIRGRLPYEQERGITGMVTVSETYDDAGDVIDATAIWQGGDKIQIYAPMLDDLNARYAAVNGDILTGCQYTLKLLAYYPDEHLYIAQRIAPPLEAPTTIDEIEF